MACEIGWVDPAHADDTMASVRRMTTPVAPLTVSVSGATGVNKVISKASRWLRLGAGLNAGHQAHRSV